MEINEVMIKTTANKCLGHRCSEEDIIIKANSKGIFIGGQAVLGKFDYTQLRFIVVQEGEFKGVVYLLFNGRSKVDIPIKEMYQMLEPFL